MFGYILHRMIFRELLRVFILSLIGITGILLMAGIVAEASQQGLNPGQILKIIPLLIPSTLPYTIPATTLFATSVVYGRLAADNEILAIRASGINMIVAVWPGLWLGVLTSVATLGLYVHIIPYTHKLMRTMFLADVEELLYTMLRKQNQICHPNLDYSIFVKGVQGRRLVEPVFKRRTPQGDIDLVAHAHEAELRVDVSRKLILVHMKTCKITGKEGVSGQDQDRIFEVDLPKGLVVDNLSSPRDMTWMELQSEGEKAKVNLARALEDQAAFASHPPQGDAMQQQILKQKVATNVKATQKILNGILAEKLMRPALAFGCLFFVLIGCPAGIWFSRSDYLSSFISCFLPIVLVYYPLVLCGTSMVKEGRYPAIPAVWSADVLMAIIGLIMFRRLLKN
jgi:lipopolysaccharide export system permease protein